MHNSQADSDKEMLQHRTELLGVSARCPDCQRLRRHLDLQRDRIGELELRLEGALQREKLYAASKQN